MVFSIIIPCYNVENYIDKCLDSVMNQTYSNIEIILVDDGSTDSTSTICDDYAKKDSRIITVHKKNGGLSSARNEGLKIANGEYVIFLDSDDYIDYKTCELLLPFAQKKLDIIVGDATPINKQYDLSHYNLKGVFSGQDFLLNSMKRKDFPMAAWLNVFRKDFLIKNDLKFKFGILHEDEEFTPRAFLLAESVEFSNVNFYYYVIRENSITTKKDKSKNGIDVYNTCLELEQIFKSLKNKALKKLLLNHLVIIYLNAFQVCNLLKFKKKYLLKKFCLRNSYTLKTKLKSILFYISPKLYFRINIKTKSFVFNGRNHDNYSKKSF